MPKSKASDAAEQELAAMKMDMEGMNTRQEEIGGKMDTVQAQISELNDKFSRLEALLTTKLSKPDKSTEPELSKDKPSASDEQPEHTWHDGPPHWRRRPANQDVEAPWYDFHYHQYQGNEHTSTDSHLQHHDNHFYSHPEYSFPDPYQQPNPSTHIPPTTFPTFLPTHPAAYYPGTQAYPYPPYYTQNPPYPQTTNYHPQTNATQYTHTYQHQPQPPPIYPPQNPGHDEAGQRHHIEPPGRTRGDDLQLDRGQYQRGDRNSGFDREAQFYKSIAKAPKMDFPKFDGSNPQEWLRMTKKYFDMVFVPEDAKFDYAQMYITGKADTWLRNSGVLEENLTWNQFCDALLIRFSTNSSYDVVDEFNSIKQGSNTVSDYTDRFEEKMADYRKENPEVKDTYYIKCYVNGLREEIRHHLKSFEPRTLYQVLC
jgi:hypothetical protein